MKTEEQPTKSYIITKALLKKHGFLAAQVVTTWLLEMPNSGERLLDLENGNIWFKPAHLLIQRNSGMREQLYWSTVATLIQKDVLRKFTDEKNVVWYSPNIMYIEELANSISMTQEEIEEEIAGAQEKLREQLQVQNTIAELNGAPVEWAEEKTGDDLMNFVQVSRATTVS